MTRGVTNGQGYANPFANNQIPLTRFDPMAVSVLKLLPQLSSSALTGNYAGYNLGQRNSKIPSVKIDHSIGSKAKFGFFWGTTGTDSQYSSPNGNADGLPALLTQARGTFIHALTLRLNFDYTLTPTMLLHLGAGYSRIRFIDTAPYTKDGGAFNCTTINVQGCFVNFNFPTIQSSLGNSSATAQTAAYALGGMQQLGNAQAHTTTNTERPTYNANITKIRGNHTFKVGGEVWFQGNITAPPSGVLFTPISTTSAGATAEPFTPSSLSGQAMGFGFANFLLGDFNVISQSAPTDLRMGKSQWALFLQDSWKVTRKLTVDYGLRWDYATANREQYGRSSSLGLTTPDPAAGGRLGAPIFEATCNCTFVNNYPYAIGPRVGIAYQINDKTVIRGGWGVAYGFSADTGGQSSAAVSNNTATGINGFVQRPKSGRFASARLAQLRSGSESAAGPNRRLHGSFLYRSACFQAAPPEPILGWHPARSLSGLRSRSILCRQPRRMVDRLNRARRLHQPGVAGDVRQVRSESLHQRGRQPAAQLSDFQCSRSRACWKRNPILRVPSTSNSLLNALRPYPQFSTIAVTNSPTGKTWYDSLQVKGTKRMSHGVQINGTFTWSKSMVSIRDDIFNPTQSKSIQSTDQPFLFTTNIVYQTQKYFGNKTLAFDNRRLAVRRLPPIR